jgi:hypothetical protein
MPRPTDTDPQETSMTRPTPYSVPDLAPQDFVGTYPLDDSVEATIPTTAQPGEPGIHWVARGLLTETCARLLARPISLDCIQQRHTTFVSAIVSLDSTVLSKDPRDVLVVVDLVLNRRTGRWILTCRDRIIAAGDCLPSPSHLAELVAIDYDHRRQPLDPSQEAAIRSEHLW